MGELYDSGYDSPWLDTYDAGDCWPDRGYDSYGPGYDYLRGYGSYAVPRYMWRAKESCFSGRYFGVLILVDPSVLDVSWFVIC